MNELISAALLGIVEGLTEFLPVSSTGHMILFGDAIGFVGERAHTFEVFIQLGAILAVVFLYWDRFLALLDFNAADSTMKGMQGIVRLGVACMPAFIVGAALHKYVKTHLFAPRPVAFGLIIGGIVLILIERFTKVRDGESLDAISIKESFTIGVGQCLALWPGVSRSASTIVPGLLLGLSRKTAAEFSFLVAVPVMCAAAGFDLLKSLHFLHTSDIPVFAVGFLVSFISAALAVKAFIAFLQRYSLIAFGYYRIALGVLVLLLLH